MTNPRLFAKGQRVTLIDPAGNAIGVSGTVTKATEPETNAVTVQWDGQRSGPQRMNANRVGAVI